jgi:phytoene dehydrogenase-like protein
MMSPMERTGDFDAVVIGSGMGGLSAAALLAKLHGMKVLVLERHYRAGGFTHTFSRPGGFSWDVGVHYVGQVEEPGMARDVLRTITGGELAWTRMPDPFERLVFPGFEFAIRSGKENFLGDLLETFPAEERAVRRYFRDVERAASCSAALAMRSVAPKPLGWAVSAASAGRRALGAMTTRAWLDANVRDPRLKAVLGARWGDYGLPPAQSSFYVHSLIAAHYFGGAFYPRGSAARIAETAIPVIEAAGGRVRVRAEVEEILVRGGRAAGVRLRGGEEIAAPRVISDAGARNTFLRLLPPEVPVPFRETLRKIPRGMAHVSLYLGLSSSPASLGVRGENFWIHDGLDPDEQWERRGRLLEGEAAHVYLSFPSMKDREARTHTAEIVAPVDAADFERWAGTRWMKRGAEYRALKDRIADALLATVERRLPGFSALVACRELSTPLSTENFTGHPGGEIYGIPFTPERLGMRWLGPRTHVPGLTLTGADALSLGVVGAMMGGLMCAVAVAGLSTFRRVAAEGRRLSAVPAMPPTPSATSPSSA